MNLGVSELLVLLLIVLLLFGASRLPKLARSLGEAQRELRRGLSRPERPDEAERAADE